MSDHSSGQPAPRGLARDIHRVKTGAKASAEELREFVKQLHGRSPQEMLGIVAQSSLIRATALASVITLVFMAAFTVGPYLWNQYNPKPVAAAPTPTAPAAAPAASPTATAAANPAAPAATVAGNLPANIPAPNLSGASPADPKMKDPLSAASEVKNFDPSANPLDNTKDDLLKGLK